MRTAAVALLLVLVAACGQPTEDDSRALNRAIGPEPETLDPQLARTTQSHTVLRDMFDGLLTYSPDGTLIEGAAQRWAVSDDGLSYSFWLRPDGRWSNGEAVVAEDFVYSFRRLVDPKTAAFYAETLINVRNAADIIAGDKPIETLGVEATERLQLTIHLQQPTAYFPALLAQAATYPVNETSITALGEAFARPGNLVSNGAYKLDRWDLGLVIELGRNEHYWNNAGTAIDDVRYHVTPVPSAELFRYRAGELDITSTVPTEAFSQVRAERPEELRVSTFLSTYYYGFNLNYEPLGDSPKLRQALSMAVDREALTEKVTGRGEQPAYSWVPPGVDHYEARQLSYADMSAADRQATAKRLYAEAGYSESKPLHIELRYNTSETHQRIALAVQSMWRDVLGFEATLINEEFRVLVANMRAMEITQIFRSSWSGDYNDAYAFLSIFESDSPSNMFGYRSEEYDSLLQRAATQIDPERRQLYLEEAERVLLADHPLMPLYYYVSKHLVRPDIRGWQDNVLDYHYSQHLSFDRTR
ncbi:MAG: peptide ABC transporter substrate-binding protein [Gammaproteobacteria bacterium]|nr:peptide ABC transporter substrate-binding protein [Gammaproteobacteria bacterium]